MQEQKAQKTYYKLLIINILYYYYSCYSLPNYLFKLKSIINNSISPPQKPFAITKAYFAIRFPYLRITPFPFTKDDLCQEKSHPLLEKVNKPFGNMEKTSYLCPRFGEKSGLTIKHSLLFRVQPKSLANFNWYNKFANNM